MRGFKGWKTSKVESGFALAVTAAILVAECVALSTAFSSDGVELSQFRLSSGVSELGPSLL